MKTYPASGPVSLRVNLADSALFAPLKSGAVASSLVRLVFDGPRVAHDGFKPMVREEAFDAGELALVTFMQARAAGLPWAMLPATVVGRFHHHFIGTSATRGRMAPRDIEGGRVGVRSYSQTTGLWVRGILAHEYGVDLGRVTWCAHDDPHVAQAPDPAFVERFPLGGRKLADLMLDGTFAAAILGNDFPDDARARPLIPEPHEAARRWYDRTGVVPLNHVFVVHADLAAQRPDVVRELWRLLLASKAASGVRGEPDTLPFGVPAMARALDLGRRYAAEQHLIPAGFTAAELTAGIVPGLAA